MADYIVINKYLHYQQGITIYPLMVGETRALEFIKSIFASHIIDSYLKDGTFELFQSNEELMEYEPIEPQESIIQDENDVVAQDSPQEPIFETMYKVTQPIQDKDGNEIELGTQFSESELKSTISQDKRQSKKKIAELLQEEKIIELKIVK
jgi:hypothetical protein